MFAPSASIRKHASAFPIGVGFNQMKCRLIQSYVVNCKKSAEKKAQEKRLSAGDGRDGSQSNTNDVGNSSSSFFNLDGRVEECWRVR